MMDTTRLYIGIILYCILLHFSNSKTASHQENENLRCLYSTLCCMKYMEYEEPLLLHSLPSDARI